MSTVRQRRKNGSVYIYESHNVWDKKSKKVRAVRTYLGREDPETGELIPSSGRPGRPPAGKAATTRPNPEGVPPTTDTVRPAAADALESQVAELRSGIAAVTAERDALAAERDALLAELASARSAASAALAALSAIL